MPNSSKQSQDIETEETRSVNTEQVMERMKIKDGIVMVALFVMSSLAAVSTA